MTLLHRLRLAANLTQTQAAALLGISQPAISQAEARESLADRALHAYGLLLSVAPDPIRPILAAHPDPLPRALRPRAAIRDAIRDLYPDAPIVYTPEIGETHDAYLRRVRVALEVRA